LKISQQAHLGGKPRSGACYNETDLAPAVCGIVKMLAAAARISPAGAGEFRDIVKWTRQN
jgi:hypothetical protein